MSVASPLIVALDYPNAAAALTLADRLDPLYCRLKVGKELFTSAGPAVVEKLHAKGFECFLDLKFHDIPATVAKAVAAASQLGVWMVNLHASGGLPMMLAAREALSVLYSPTLLIGVTVLTSMSQEVYAQTGFSGSIEDRVNFLAKLAADAGLDGVVCSALEVRSIKNNNGTAFLAVTPGIRPLGADNQDQSRVVTPEAAITAGSDYLVVGRPVTEAVDPAQRCYEIFQSLKLKP
jgi:orotidine-5'-phosphate decarboxylase